jgi:hypothetical protein
MTLDIKMLFVSGFNPATKAMRVFSLVRDPLWFYYKRFTH